MKTAVAFLTNNPRPSTLDFAKQVEEYTPFDVFIVDDTLNDIPKSSQYKVVQIANSHCLNSGYCNSSFTETTTSIRKNPIAYDKFCFYFCKLDTSYDFVWVFEDDVFIPRVETIKRLHILNYQADLVTANNTLKNDTTPDWHWKHIFDKTEPPYYYSMVCAAGMSKKMLQAVANYVKQKGTLFYVEAMFNTLAMQNNLVVNCPAELKSIVWMGEWNLDTHLLLPNNVFHPCKNIDEHWLMRKRIAKAKYQGYKPTAKLPSFLFSSQI